MRIGTKESLMASGSIFLIVGTIFTVLLGIGAIVSFGLFTADPDNRSNVITVSGTGEAFAIPDVATFSFTSKNNSRTVKESQESVSKQVAMVLAALNEIGIEEKDIKTTSYNSYPQYEWRQNKSLCVDFSCPPVNRTRELVGYEQSQTIQIKVRDLDKVSSVLQTLGDAGVDSMNGPNFAVDDQDVVLAEARKEAISKANQKAIELAGELGVKLGKVVSFSDNSGGYYPIAARSFASLEMSDEGSFSPELPVGENKITANVSVSYKIK